MDFMIGCILAGFGVIVILAIVAAYFRQPKCPNCGKRKCYKKAATEVGSEYISIQKEEKMNHYSKKQIAGSLVDPLQKHSPESVTIRRYTVPGIRTFYDVTYVCRTCGNEFSRREHQDRES
jgi:hypothetical protein